MKTAATAFLTDFERKSRNYSKKVLTPASRCGILLKLSLRGAAVELKNGLKRTKKFLTNGFRFDIINKLF